MHPTATIDWFAGAEPEDAARWRTWWETDPVPAPLAAAHAVWSLLAAALAPGAAPRDPADWAALIQSASDKLLAALESTLPDPDASDPAVASAASGLFLASLNRQLEARRAPVRCGLVFPGARFDPDTMEAADSLSGNRFLVHAVSAWLVRDVTGPTSRVAARARVVTA